MDANKQDGTATGGAKHSPAIDESKAQLIAQVQDAATSTRPDDVRASVFIVAGIALRALDLLETVQEDAANDAAALQREIVEVDTRTRALLRDLNVTRQDREDALVEAMRLRTEAKGLREINDQQRDFVDGAVRERDEISAACGRIGAELHEARGDLRTAREAVERLQGENSAVTRARDEALGFWGDLNTQCGVLRIERNAARQDVATAHAEIARLNGEVDRLTRERDAANANALRLQAMPRAGMPTNGEWMRHKSLGGTWLAVWPGEGQWFAEENEALPPPPNTGYIPLGSDGRFGVWPDMCENVPVTR